MYACSACVVLATHGNKAFNDFLFFLYNTQKAKLRCVHNEGTKEKCSVFAIMFNHASILHVSPITPNHLRNSSRSIAQVTILFIPDSSKPLPDTLICPPRSFQIANLRPHPIESLLPQRHFALGRRHSQHIARE